MKDKKKPQAAVDFSKPTVVVALRFPFMYGTRQVREIALRTEAYVADIEEMDSEEENETNRRTLRLIATLSDIDRNGKGIPHTVLSEKLRSSDYMRLAAVAGEILSPDEPEVEQAEGEADPKEGSAETLRAIGGTSQR